MPRKTPETEEEREQRLIRYNPWNGAGSFLDWEWSEVFWRSYELPSLAYLREQPMKGRVVA